MLAIQTVLAGLVKWKGIDYAPDPIPLFFLALVFGALYHRTHRIAPSLVLHMAFNATSIAGCSSQGSRDIIKKRMEVYSGCTSTASGADYARCDCDAVGDNIPLVVDGQIVAEIPVGNSAVSNSRLEVPCLGD